MAREEQWGGGVGSASPPGARTREGAAGDPAVYGRIVAAAIDVVATLGFAATKTEDIIAAAGIGRRTFWKYFPDKTAALTAGYEQITRQLRIAVQEAYDREPAPARRVVACLTAMAGFLAADPVRAEVLLVQGPAVGREVIEIRTETIQGLAVLLAKAVAELPDGPVPADAPDGPRARVVIEALAGGLYEVAYTRTVRGEVRELPGLVPELAQIVLGPHLRRRPGTAGAAVSRA